MKCKNTWLKKEDSKKNPFVKVKKKNTFFHVFQIHLIGQENYSSRPPVILRNIYGPLWVTSCILVYSTMVRKDKQCQFEVVKIFISTKAMKLFHTQPSSSRSSVLSRPLETCTGLNYTGISLLS